MALAAALTALAFPANVEVEGTLAILVPVAAQPFPTSELRTRLVAAARAAGFTHAAIDATPSAAHRAD